MIETQPVICIVTTAARDDANRVWAAMGRGPETFSVPLTADLSPTLQSTVSHYLMADSSCSVPDVAAWQALANGDLPQIDGIWGVDGVIGSALAQAATIDSNLQVYAASGDVEPIAHAEAVLSSRGLCLLPSPY